MNHSILLVEDVLIARKVTKELLSGKGITIDTAKDGKQALHLFKTNTYQMVLMDIGLSKDLDGFQTAQAMRLYEREKNLKKTHIIAITAHIMIKHDPFFYLQHGLDDLIEKPLTPEKIARLREMIKQL